MLRPGMVLLSVDDYNQRSMNIEHTSSLTKSRMALRYDNYPYRSVKYVICLPIKDCDHTRRNGPTAPIDMPLSRSSHFVQKGIEVMF